MLRKAIYPKIENLVNPIASFLKEKNISPNQLTLAGVLLSFITGLIYSGGFFVLGGLFLLLAGLANILGGALARLKNQTSQLGAFFESIAGHCSVFFVFSGLSVYFAKDDETGWLLVCLGIILASFLVGYIHVRSESLVKHAPVGIIERPEIIAALIAGTLFSFLLSAILLLLFVGLFASAIQKMMFISNTLQRPKDTEEPNR